jgi:DNA-directed RNA polymerase subunit beta'
MKDLGFYYSTISGVTISAFDVRILEKKYQLIAEADEQVKKYNRMYRRGIMLNSERKRNVIRIWEDTKKEIEKEIKVVMKEEASINDIFLMADSGARGSSSNFIQLAGMRGLMAKPNGESMEIPVKACFSEGMSMSDFFISTHGARKGSNDTELKTAESGY